MDQIRQDEHELRRAEFLTEFTDELRETFAIRAKYLDLRGESGT